MGRKQLPAGVARCPIRVKSSSITPGALYQNRGREWLKAPGASRQFHQVFDATTGFATLTTCLIAVVFSMRWAAADMARPALHNKIVLHINARFLHKNSVSFVIGCR